MPLIPETLSKLDFINSIDHLLSQLVWFHFWIAKELAQSSAENAEERQKDFNHGSNGFSGWDFVHKPQRKIKRNGTGNAKPQEKRGFEQKDAKETKIG